MKEGETGFVSAIEQVRDAGTLDAEFFGEPGRGETLHFEETLESVVHEDVIFRLYKCKNNRRNHQEKFRQILGI